MKRAKGLLRFRAAVLSLLVAFSTGASAQTVAPAFSGTYSIRSLGGIAGLPTPYGGLAFKDGDANTLLIGGRANLANGRVHAVPLVRGADGHISSFGAPVAQGYGAFIDSGLTYGPGGVLFYSKYPNNQVGQVKPGASADSAVVGLAPLGIPSSPGAQVFVPAGYSGANRLKISSYSDGKFYDVPYSPMGDGTYTFGAASLKATLSGGPEGLIYAPIGSPLFPNQTLLVTEYSAGKVAAYDIDAEGNPVVATRRDFITGLSGGEGATIDPVTGDFLFTSYGTNTLFQVRGFTRPPPPATVAVTSSVNPANFGAAVAFTANVTGVAPVSGTVTFKDNGTDIAGCVDLALSAGSVGCVTSALAVGSHTIAAYYGGNSTNSASSGSLTQTINGLPPGTTTPPSGATSVTTGSATLQGAVSGNGLTTTANFQYGTTTAYGSTVAATPSSVGPTAVNQAVSASVTGLACGTTYFYRVQAVNSAGTAFGADSSFTTLPCPTLVSLSPDNGPSAGGTVVTLTGSGFGAGMYVNLDGVSGACSPQVTVTSTTSATCVLKPGAAGPRSLSVGMPGGVSNALTYTYDGVPTITRLDPAKGPTAGGWPITLTGTGFVAGMTVSVAGAAAPCQPVTVQGQTTATCLMPPHPTGTAALTVTTPGGNVAKTVIYLDSPEVTAISPARGPAAGGTVITLTGSSFLFVTSITVGGVACASKSVASLTEATCRVPPGVAGNADVVVRTPVGTSPPVPFTYDNVPAVTGVKPSQGPVAGGTQITVSGTSFVAGSSTVSVGGKACGSVRHLSDAKLTCVTPAGAAGIAGVVVTTAGGASAPGTFTYYDVPTIATVSPPEGVLAGGTTITLTGTSFIAGKTSITVGGAACTGVTVIDQATATCVTPAGTPGVVDVLLTTPGGTSAPGFYTYDDVPTVALVDPAQGPTGGGTVIQVTGTTFVSGLTTVTVGSAACAGVSVVSPTSLACTTPAGAAGVVNVAVATPGGTSAPGFFTYTDIPVIKNVKPSQGPLAGGTITISGSSFTTGATVSVGGAACTGVVVTGGKSLTCTVPAAAAGVASVTVTTSGGTSAPGFYTYDDVPTLGAISPAEGPVAGGTTITLDGTAFVSGSTTVLVGGVPCTGVSVASATSLSCVTPAGAAGVAVVSVSTPGGSSNTLAFVFDPVPTLATVAPASGPVAGGTLVSLTGTGFVVGATAVSVGGTPCTAVSVTSATQLTCSTPANAAGAASVVVTTPGGASGAVTFTYDPAPAIASVSPSRGPEAGSTQITISGTTFVNGATTVTVGGAACASVSVSGPTSLTCVTPAGTGAATVVATTPAGASPAATFTYDPVPTVSGVSPTGGPLAGGTTITVSGSGFVSGNTTVTVGGTACGGVVVVSATSLTCVTPAGTAGATSVTVTTAGGGSNAGVFTYDAVPTLAGVDPASGPIAGGTTITLFGTEFVAGATSVSVGGLACASVRVSGPSVLTCVTPAAPAGVVNIVVTTPGGTSAPGSYTYSDIATLAAITPASGITTGGTVITLSGAGFVAGMTVGINGVAGACTGVTVLGPTSASCTMPARPAGLVSVTVTTPGGTTAGVPFTYVAINSATTAIDPNYGPSAGGTTIQITGAGFFPGTTVSVDGVADACKPFVPTDTTLATCVMPPHAAGTVNVVVTNASGSSAPMAYTYNDAPRLDAVSPAAGPTAGGSLLKLSGASFVAGMAVSVDGVAGACGSVTVTSQTAATCVMPAHAAGVVNVAVTTPFGTSATWSFTYTNVPTLAAVTPGQGPLGGGTVIKLTGTGFVAGMGVTVGGTACMGVTIVGSDEARCTTPSGAAGVANVVVTTGGGSTAPLPFRYGGLPAITGISPTHGATAGGTLITVTGTSFVLGQTGVLVDGIACAGVSVASDASLTCKTPPGSAGAVNVVVTTPVGASLPAPFTYDNAPKLTAVSPNQGPTAGGTTITLTGASFVAGGMSVTVGGAACTNLSVTSDSTATCVTPPGAAGTANVSVTTVGGTGGPVYFTYDNKPVVKSVKPGQGPLAGGTTITLTGSAFIVGATTVTVGGSACTNVVVSGEKSLTCVTPAGTAGVKEVLATTVGGTSAPAYFTYDNVPTVAGVSPAVGLPAGGTLITVFGTGFVANATTVSVGGVACAGLVVQDSTSLTCTTPPGSAGAVNVVVTTPGGTSAPGFFTYSAATATPRLANVATRALVLTGDNVMIGGFIVGGTAPKKVLITARGPSLAVQGVSGTLSDPFLTLYSGATPILTNDDFGTASNAFKIPPTMRPGNAKESAILTTLNPGPYTAIVTGVGGATGIGIVEVFELDTPETPLINVATRAPALTGDNVMIGGFIIQGDAPMTVLVTARGPSLAAQGVPGVLADPVLTLYSGATAIAANDDWETNANAASIRATGVAPPNSKEAALLMRLNPGAYTAIITGANGTTGIGIVEVFAQ